MRYFSVIFFAACALALAVRAETINFIAAIVNEAIITQRQVEQSSSLAIEGLQMNPHVKPKDYRTEASSIMRDVLEHLVENQLILSDYKSGTIKIPQNVIDQTADSRIKKQFGDRTALAKKLKEMGMSYETFRQQFQDGVILDFMNQRHISSGLLISPQKIEQYYQTNQARYKLADQVRLRMIVLNRPESEPVEDIRRLAQEIHTIVDRGASFAEMASIHSEGTQRAVGGDWGWEDGSKLTKGFAEVAFALEKGTNSPVLGKTTEKKAGDPYYIYEYDKDGRIALFRKYNDKDELIEEKKADARGPALKAPVDPDEFYLMYVEDKRPARTRPLTEVRDEIERQLKLREQDRLRKAWIKRLKGKAFVRTFAY